MKHATIAAIAVVSLLALAGSAGAAPMFRVSDDRGKYDDDGGAWFFSELSELGLRANKMTVNWDPARPDVIADQAFLDRSVPQAIEHGVQVSFGIQSARRGRSPARRARSTGSSSGCRSSRGRIPPSPSS